MDFPDDGRAFATGDFDGDGDVDLILKSRNAPGLRVIRNDWAASGRAGDSHAVAIRLRGRASNTDAVGARVSLVAGGRRQAREVTAGNGFLSQSSKELVFGIGSARAVEELRLTWPSGQREVLPGPVANQRLTVVEGSGIVRAEEFRAPGGMAPASRRNESVPDGAASGGVWLTEPALAPQWELPDLEGAVRHSSDHLGAPLLLTFWATWCPPCRQELRELQSGRGVLDEVGVRMATVSVDEPGSEAAVARFAREEGFTLPVLLADQDFVAAYNLVRRHLLSRRSDLRLPTSLLLNAAGRIEKLYEGPVSVSQVREDARLLGEPVQRRLERAMPFAGRWLGPRPRRDPARLASALYAHGLRAQALRYLEEVVALIPASADARYNLATALAEEGRLSEARDEFRRAVGLSPRFPEARNGLGAVLARMGDPAGAADQFRLAWEARPSYIKAVGNLATAFENSGQAGRAIKVLESALAENPDSSELLNRLGAVRARQGSLDAAAARFEQSLAVTSGNAVARMQLALVAAQRGQLGVAAAQLEGLIGERPEFDDAYLALSRVRASAGDMDAATGALNRLLERRPGHVQARRLLDGLRAAR